MRLRFCLISSGPGRCLLGIALRFALEVDWNAESCCEQWDERSTSSTVEGQRRRRSQSLPPFDVFQRVGLEKDQAGS